MSSRAGTLVSLLFVVCGCANYRYVLLEPSDAPRVIDDERTVRLPHEPLEYRFADAERYLLMRIANPMDRAVLLIGYQSYVVDPRGETHPLPGGIIAPHAYIDLLLPHPPRVYRITSAYPYWTPRPLLYGYRRYPYWYDPWYDPWYDYPPPTYFVRESGPFNWSWGTGEVQVRLLYEREPARSDGEVPATTPATREAETFEHKLVIRREKER